MDRNEKIAAIATFVIVTGSTALFAIKRVQARKNNVTVDAEMDEMIDVVSSKKPANN